MALPRDAKTIKFSKVSCWTLMKAFFLCMSVAICSVVLSLVGHNWLSTDSEMAVPSSLAATRNGDDYIWDTGASIDLMGVQDATNLSDADKITLNPPLAIETVAGPGGL